MTDDAAIYAQRFESFLNRTARELENFVSDLLTDLNNIDHVSARAKDPARFAEKATRTQRDGSPKYQQPLIEIQDQIGVRIVVFYEATVGTVMKVIDTYFHAIEEKELVPESSWEFGYFGTHFVLALPHDVVPPEVDMGEVPSFFELQIKTLFQHAWSQANHDLGYKAPKELSGDQKRRLAFTAAQAWGADRIFQELHSELT